MVARLRTWLGGAPQYDGIGARIMTTARRVAIAATLGVVVLTAVGLTLSRGNPEDVQPAATQAKPATKVAKKPTVFVAPDGSDDFGCTRNRPCLTFAAAYATAKPGDIVEVAGGTYAGQKIEASLSKTSGPAVVFRPAANATVTLSEELRVEATYADFRRMVMPDWYAGPTAHHLTFRDIDAGMFYITGANNISVYGGDYGPQSGLESQIKACADCTSPPKNLLVDGAYFHDYARPDERHVECLHVLSADTLTIRNSRFQRCAVMNLGVFHYGPAGPTTHVVIENNFFDRPTAGGFYAVDIDPQDDMPLVDFLVRNNSALATMYVNTASGVENVRLIGNVGPRQTNHCYEGVVFAHNIWDNAKCGPTDRKAPLGFRNPAKFDLHLKLGAAAIGRGDKSNYPATDIDGQKRPLGRRVDAGADEVVG